MQNKMFKKALSLLLSVVMLVVSLFTGVTAFAEDGVYTASRINIHPGIDDTYLNFSWQSEELANPASVRIKAEGSDEWTVFTGESKAFVIKDGYEEGYHDTFVKNCGHTCSDICGHEACTASQCYHGTYTLPYYNMVTVSGLEYGVSYTYQLGDGTNWSKDYTTQVADSDPNEGFSYLVFGDSQTADQYYGDYMKKALELSVDKFDDIDFIMNLGDNVHENNDRNYNAYFTAQDVLATYPIAVVVGNHELNLCTNGDRINFSDHPTLALQNPPAANGRQDHWFRYGDVLFITFNSGPQQTSMMTDLDQLIKDAKAAHPDTRWTILQTHQGFYANGGGGKNWRKDFTSVISKYDIDLVFNGHHHLYTRTESLVYDSALTCTHEKSSPVFSCAACSGSVEPLGANDVQVQDTFVGAVKHTTGHYYDELAGVDYNKTVERYDPQGITYVHLDSLTAEGHDQYATIAGSTLAATSAFSINTKEGQGAITKVTVGKDAQGNDQLKVETFWINNGGTPRVSDSKPLSLLDDDFIEDTPYDTYTIHKTTPVKDVEVTFDGGTDRGIFTRKINSGEAVAKPANPIMTGKSFKYWTLDGETKFDFATTLTEDTVLTAVYEDIPPTTTADLFAEAVNRGDKEIILAGDITLTDVVTFNANTTVKSVEGQKYTLTLDGAARLVVAKGKKVTFDGIGITIAATANTIADAYNNGTYITVGSGGNRADLYIYNSTIKNLSTNLGAANTGIIASSKNASSAVRFENSVVTSAVTNTSSGGSILGQYITVYATDTSMTNAKSGAWFCTSSAKIILYGNSSYVGWKHNSAKLYDFRNATVKIARNKDNLIELSKVGTGTAVTSDNYKIYYAFEDTAFAAGTAIEYTGPIADVDYETPVYATVYYTGTSYYGDVTSKTCGEYIEGVAVSTADGFVEALANYETVITLTSDITLADLGNLTINANTTIKSTQGNNFTITLDGTSRLVVAQGKTATINGVNVTVAATATQLTSWGQGYITVGSDNTAATLYIKNSTINCLSSDIGSTDHALLRADQNAASKIYVENSKITASISGNNGVLLAGANATFYITNSDVLARVNADWLCTSTNLVIRGTVNYRGYKGNGYKLYDFTNVTVKAARNKDNLIELSKIGSGTAVNSANYVIYYALSEDAFASGTATEYTAPIADIDYETPIYVAIRYTGTSHYGLTEEKVCGEYVEGVAVSTAEGFAEALANGDSLLTLTSDITLTDLGTLTIGANTVIQSKSGQQYSIILDGNTRITVAANKTLTFNNVKLYLAATATPITDSANDAYYNGYITVKTGAKLYLNNCRYESLLTNMGCSTASMIKIYRYDGSTGYVELNNSTVISPSAADKGIALSSIVFGTNTKPTFRLVDSTVQGNWVFYQGFFILEGSTQLLGNAYRYNAYIMDYRNATVSADRDADGNVVLSVDGDVKYKNKNTDTVTTLTDYKIYYSVGEDTSGTTNEYTGAITGIDADTPIYVTIQINKVYAFYSIPTELTVPEAVFGDLNGDGTADYTDVALLRQHIIGAVTLQNADLNGDGVTDICDLVLLANGI
ncbi:MAG: metallophosphoesterase [Clostridia bacterium]|nr:metallophosphoesterase [Clostridia bacterium]